MRATALIGALIVSGTVACGGGSLPPSPGQPDAAPATSSGGNPESGPPAGPDTCSVSSRGTACMGCMQTQCPAACQTCGTGADCASLAACRNACGTDNLSCIPLCEHDHQAGDGPYGQLLDCMGRSCGDACDMVDCSQLFATNPGCSTCAATTCIKECLQYREDPQASIYGRCYVGCHDMACIDACSSVAPDGVNQFLSLYGPVGCVATRCKTQCGF